MKRVACCFNQNTTGYSQEIERSSEGDKERPGYARVIGFPTAFRWTLQQWSRWELPRGH